MKNICIFLGILFISCTSYKQQKTSKLENLYHVYKLDSINNYYLIYAKKQDTIYKVVSKKEKLANCKMININSDYEFTLHSMRDSAPVINGIKMTPVNYMDINCYQFDENTSICKEKDIYDLYFSDNIKGLCFIND